MNDELEPVEEQALEVMLAEALGSAGPPDLSGDILQQLRTTPLVQTGTRSVPGQSHAGSRRKLTVLVTVVTALAATVMIAIWIRSAEQRSDAPKVAGNDPGPVNLDPAPSVSPAIDSPPIGTPQPAPQKPTRGIPMDLVHDPPATEATAAEENDPAVTVPAKRPLEAVVLVSQQVDSNLRRYWQSIGIEPSADASPDDVLARLSAALGVQLSPDAIQDAESLETELKRPAVALGVSRRWLQQITQRGSSRMDPEASKGLINDLADCFQTKRNFDQTLASWINGESPNSSAFYAAVSSGPKHANDSNAMIRRIAALTMNVDLRCTQCHDSYIEGNGRQEDFWAFAAFVRRSVIRQRNGQVTIAPTATGGKPFFYELPDGRQGVAQPSVATQWIQGDANRPITSVRQWSQRLVGSTELARGVVNSLWQLVHRQPLRGRVVDPISAPHNDQLDQLEEKLVQDLIRSEFDVARTLALIISSPATGRSVPSSLLPENAWVADDAEIQSAGSAVDAFAAAQPPDSRLPMNVRFDQAMRAIGAKLSTDQRPIVAQLNAAAGEPRPIKPNVTDAISSGFPVPTDSLPVQWLASIEDHTSQVQHLAYLAGMSQAPPSLMDAAEKMRAANNNPTALQRVWWMVRP